MLSSMLAIAKLKIPINMVVCIPLTENMPSGKATKPGDIIVSMAGKTIEVDNTDAEGDYTLLLHISVENLEADGNPSRYKADWSSPMRFTTHLPSTSQRSSSMSLP